MTLFSLWKSTHNRNDLSFLATRTTGEDYRLLDSSIIMPSSCISITIFSTCSGLAKDSLLGACTIGCAFPVLILCCIKSVASKDSSHSFTCWLLCKNSRILLASFVLRYLKLTLRWVRVPDDVRERDAVRTPFVIVISMGAIFSTFTSPVLDV